MKSQSGKSVSSRIRAGVLAGVALVLLTGASVGAGAASVVEPPRPPAPPVAPLPPTPPPAPMVARNVVIVERHGPDGENDAAHIRTITRDGKTFVFKTDTPLSDEEVERRVADADARIPPVPPAPDAMSGRNLRRVQQRVIVLNDKDEEVTDVIAEEGERCQGRKVFSDVDSSAEDDGKVTRVRIRMCGSQDDIEKHARAEAMQGVRKARDEIARDRSLSDAIRKEILKDLDAELARMKSEG